MNIGINLLYLIPGVVGGTETYSRNLIAQLLHIDKKNKYFLFVASDAKQGFSEFSNDVVLVDVANFSVGKLKRIVWEQFFLPGIIKQYDISILFSPGYVVPIFASCNQIVTIPDLLYKRFPDTIPRLKLLYWKIFIPLSVKYAKRIIAISEFTKNELLAYFPESEKKITTTPLGVDRQTFGRAHRNREYVLSKYQLPDRFIICVATLSPHKNLDIVLKAIATLKAQRCIVNLVLVGNKERAYEKIQTSIEKLRIADQVRILGYVPNLELSQIYTMANLFVLPSIYEGFGLPVLEAMSNGCPVLCSNAGSLPEVAGDAAEYFYPHDVQQLSDKIKNLFFDGGKRDVMRKKGFENIKRFDWKNTANETLKVIESLNTK